MALADFQSLWDGAIKPWIRSLGLDVTDIASLAADYVFSPGETVALNGSLYRCTSATQATPLTLATQGGSLVYVELNGQRAYAVTGTTLNAGWQKVTDVDDKFWAEQRLATKAARATTLSGYGIGDAYTKAQVDALTRHTRLTDFDLATLRKAVADQNLEKYGLKVGDQKTINGNVYIIAGLNPMKGSTLQTYPCTADHVGLIVVPDAAALAWNASGNTYTGAGGRGAGYANSDLHYYLKNTVLPLVKADLGEDRILSHGKLLTNAVNQSGYNRLGGNTGCASGHAWEFSYIAALSEAQVCGGTVWSSSGYDTGEASQQLEVFRKYKYTELFGVSGVWLRDVVSATEAAFLCEYGQPSMRAATYQYKAAALVLFH